MAIINFYKPIGWTPLECIEHLKKTYPEYTNSSMTYAGRLDPMAEGVVLILSEEDRYKKEDFQKLDKTYKASFLFGVSSDTHDALGLIKKGGSTTQEDVEDAIQTLLGTHTLPLPIYASYKVQGKPLHWWAREGRIDEIEIPIRTMQVLDLHSPLIETQSLSSIREESLRRIDLVQGDFRQSEIMSTWNDLQDPDQEYIIATITLTVTSGTYIRSFAQLLGDHLQCGTILLTLQRLSVDRFSSIESIHCSRLSY